MVQRVKALETDLQQMNDNFSQQNEAKDDMLRSLQGYTMVTAFSD